MPSEVASTRSGSIIYDDERQTVELMWLPASQDATEAEARETMLLFAEQAEKLRPRFLIVDTLEFRHTWEDGMEAWRHKEIIPRYNAAGVTKLAFITGENVPFPTVETGAAPEPEADATFPTGWFTGRDRAYQWLSES